MPILGYSCDHKAICDLKASYSKYLRFTSPRGARIGGSSRAKRGAGGHPTSAAPGEERQPRVVLFGEGSTIRQRGPLVPLRLNVKEYLKSMMQHPLCRLSHSRDRSPPLLCRLRKSTSALNSNHGLNPFSSRPPSAVTIQPPTVIELFPNAAHPPPASYSSADSTVQRSTGKVSRSSGAPARCSSAQSGKLDVVKFSRANTCLLTTFKVHFYPGRLKKEKGIVAPWIDLLAGRAVIDVLPPVGANS